MIYTGDLVTIDNNVIPYIKQYKITRAKLWKNADRNMKGDVRATLIGIFPKVQIQVGHTTEDELAVLTAIFDKNYFQLEWFDVRVQEKVKYKYYANDYDTDLLFKERGIYAPFNVNLIPVSKRSYT